MLKRILISVAIVTGALAYAGVRPDDISHKIHALSQQGAGSMMGDDNDGYGYN